tara:strand:+ start:2263 stop:2775 length:513 start_codon:yes stop_codon:yes gene_type:complete
MDILKKNYFDLFGIEVSIEVNKPALDNKYNNLQQQFHPDKYSNSSSHEKRLALQISSYINDGYVTLGDLIKRIDYIFKINNFKRDESETLKDDNFLLEQIEFNEFIDNIKENDSNQVSSYQNNIIKKISLSINDIKNCYLKKDFEEMWNIFCKLRFYIKHANELNDKLTS